ncbi:unnamed protein product [Musa acuminata subsp. burmannicoides]
MSTCCTSNQLRDSCLFWLLFAGIVGEDLQAHMRFRCIHKEGVMNRQFRSKVVCSCTIWKMAQMVLPTCIFMGLKRSNKSFGGDRTKLNITPQNLGVSLKSMGMMNEWLADPLHLLGHGFAAALSAGNAIFPQPSDSDISPIVVVPHLQ